MARLSSNASRTGISEKDFPELRGRAMRTRLAVVAAALLCSVAALVPASAATHDDYTQYEFGPIGPDKPGTQTVVFARTVKCEWRKGCS